MNSLLKSLNKKNQLCLQLIKKTFCIPYIPNIAVQNLRASFTSNMDLVKTFFNELVKTEISGKLEFDLLLSPLHFGQTAAKQLQPSLTLKALRIFL